MTKFLIALAGILLSPAALAHPSLMPHSHPHGASPLVGVDVLLLLLFVIAACGLVAFRKRS